MKKSKTGAIVDDKPVFGFQKLDAGSAKFYEGEYFLCESVTPDGSKLIISAIRFFMMTADSATPIEGETFVDALCATLEIDLDLENEFRAFCEGKQIVSSLDCILQYMEFLYGKNPALRRVRKHH